MDAHPVKLQPASRLISTAMLKLKLDSVPGSASPVFVLFRLAAGESAGCVREGVSACMTADRQDHQYGNVLDLDKITNMQEENAE